MTRAGRAAMAAALGALAAACGGGGSSAPTSPPAPTPPGEVYSVSGLVFYDENRNNVLDPDETVRLGDVEVQVAGRTAASAATGRVLVEGVPAGAHPVLIQAPSLPPFFVAGAPVTVEVPRASETPIPVALPIGQNRPYNYLVEGDSISQGFGSRDGLGYRAILEARLEVYYGRSVTTFYRGDGGGTSRDGAARIAYDLGRLTPAYTLISWGTNDWNECGNPQSCYTVPSLRTIVREVKGTGSLPCVATIPPANVGYDYRAPASRNAWVAEANELIRAMAREEGALLVDVHAAFMAQPNLADLFVDHVHPNPRGHELIATAFFDALTRPRSLSGADAPF